MTRLTSDDIKLIASRLNDYNHELKIKTGKSLVGIACHSYSMDESAILNRAMCCSIFMVPVTAGLGIIGDFSATVCVILRFLGFRAEITPKNDTAGIALAFERGADAIFMADDDRFIGLDLRTRAAIDNSEATGRVYSAALDLMAGGVKDKEVLVLGAGPVGEASIRSLQSFGAHVGLYDCSYTAASSLLKKIARQEALALVEDPLKALTTYRYIIDATPADNIIPDNLIFGDTFIAAPGVPLGVSEKSRILLGNRLIHDKLELGVAAMAVSLLSSSTGR